MRPRHLYLHVPFCARRCSYCDFAVTVDASPPRLEWVEAVATELSRLATVRSWDMPWQLETVYCGGGTPSLLGAGIMATLRDRLSGTVYWGPDAEWTCEANPESFTRDVAREWRAAGVNRLSLGAQTFDDSVLRWMGRLHGSDGPARAVEAARAEGIGNVSLDLIFGLPQRLGRAWGTDLERTLELRPDHISLYGLTAEPATPLGRWVSEGRERLADEGEYAAQYHEAVDRLGAAGYEAYEVSNFALSGRESRHNQAYWDGRAYVGLGPSAHSFIPPERWWNVRDWADYAGLVQAGKPTVGGREEVQGEAELLERLWLGLRRREGVPLGELAPGQREQVADWARRGWGDLAGNRFRLNAEGWLRLDALAVSLSAAGVEESPVA